MNELEQAKLKLVEKSILALNQVLGALDSFDMNYATEMYNTLLTAFESLQEKPEGYIEDSAVEKCLTELEEEHKKIIAIFESGSLENLSSIIKEEILARYLSIKEHYEEKEFLAKNNMDIHNESYQEYKKAGLMENMDEEVIAEIQSYWEEHFKQQIDPTVVLAYYNFTGKLEPGIISQVVFNRDIWLMLNDRRYFTFYEDKNTYDFLIDADYAPEVVLKRVNGQYFTKDNETISRTSAFQIVSEMKEDLFIKRSLSNDGKGIGKIEYRGHAFYFKDKRIDLRNIEDTWGIDFIVQKVIKQHPFMAEPHEHSVNTFRMVTLRWNNEIHYLTTFARFGAHGDVNDNAGTGGITVGVSSEGDFNDFGMDVKGVVYKKHPTTGFKFKNFKKMPNFHEYIDYVKKLHNRILHHDYVSWDIAMGRDGKPIFIEMNFRGPIELYQLRTQRPIFGELTEEILAKAAEEREKKKKKDKKQKKKKPLNKDRKYNA